MKGRSERRAGASGNGWMRHEVEEAHAGSTVSEILTGPMGLSRRMLQRLTRARGIALNGARTHLDRKVKAGDIVGARVPARPDAGLAPVAMELTILHEDRDVLIVDKPPFLLVHPTRPEHERTLAHGVAHHLAAGGAPGAVHPVHRIDRDTSGLVLFARSSVAHHRLDLQLREGTIARVYEGFVDGRVADDTRVLDAPTGRHPADPTLRAVTAAGDPATTELEVVERFADATRVRLRLRTGRTHQVRVHLAHIGHPLLGDTAYGGRRVPGLRRQALHAARLEFESPTSGERVTVDSPLPPDLEALRARLASG